MLKLKKCEDCIFSYSKDFGLYCSFLENSSGGDLRVKREGSCNHFSERPNSSNSGYNSGSSGCFLTSACVDYFGKPDDCYELTTLRKFRDNYLAKTEEGKKIISQYYKVAPAIIEKINNSDSKDKFYLYIYDEIKKCISHIENDKNESALTVYMKMVQYFMEA